MEAHPVEQPGCTARLAEAELAAYRDHMTGWIIAAAELRIPWDTSFAAHRMVVIVNPRREAVRQLNGLASWYDRQGQRWRHKPIGYLPTDRLRGYDTQTHPRTFMPINGAALGSRDVGPAIERGAMRVLADGLSESAVATLLAPALEAMRRINALSPGPEGGSGQPYPLLGFGPNSNSFFSTMLYAMSFERPVFARPARIVPGARGLLLPRAELDKIKAALSPAPPFKQTR